MSGNAPAIPFPAAGAALSFAHILSPTTLT
jgi:hypothetical protein